MKKRSTVEEISRQLFGDDEDDDEISEGSLTQSQESEEHIEINRKRKKTKETEYEAIELESNINIKTTKTTKSPIVVVPEIFKTNNPEEITKILKEYQKKEENIKEHTLMSKLKNSLEDMMPMFDYDFRVLDSADDFKHIKKTKDEIDWDEVKELEKSVSTYSTYAGPILLCERFTSYGRHFTKTEILKLINEILIRHILNDDTLVDFSCGSNEWLWLLKESAEISNIKVNVKSFDLFTPKYLIGWERKSWFDVRGPDLPQGEKLIIGLNPPFGINGEAAQRFLDHALSFEPKLIAVISPKSLKIPNDYNIIFEDSELCKDKSFFVPGSNTQSWNLDAPPFKLIANKNMDYLLFREKVK